MKKAVRLIAMFLCLCMLLSACGPTGEPGGTQAPGTQNPEGSQPPAVRRHASSIYDSLVRFNGSNQFEVIPDLAESWEISEDQMEFTFHLRQAKWSDGSDFTADDVVFSIERMQTQPSTASKVLMIKGAEKVDEHTVKILCNYAYPNLILQMASWPWRMVSKKAVEAAGDGVQGMVIGTGPYKLESWTADQRPGHRLLLHRPGLPRGNHQAPRRLYRGLQHQQLPLSG